jgi:Tfp pilus assembly protein PilF
MNPDYAEIYISRGLTYIKLNNKQKACDDFRKSLNMGYKNAQEHIDKYCK